MNTQPGNPFRKWMKILVLPVLAWTLPAAAQTFDDSMSVVVVEVPVSVLADGKPVMGLTRDDFQIFEGKKEQEILDFEVIDLTQATRTGGEVRRSAAPVPVPQAIEIPISARRHFLVLFDLLNSESQSIFQARAAAVDLVNNLHPTDLVAVGTNARSGPRLMLGFTSDHRQAEAAIATLGLPQFIEVRQDPLSLMFGDFEGGTEQLLTSEGLDGVGTGDFLAALHDMARRQNSMQSSEQQSMVAGQTQALEALAQIMNQIQGRKHVVLLSEGFDSSLLYGSQNAAARNSMSSAAQNNRIYEVDSEEMFGDTRSMGNLERMLEEFRRANCTIQAVDIGGIDHQDDVQLGSSRAAAAERAGSRGREETLTTFARSTGGKLYKNTNNLSVAMSDMLETTGVTYLIAYQPKKIKLDGKYHRIKVQLRDKQRGVELIHRPGYYAPKPFSELQVGERQLLTAQHILSGHETQGFNTHAMATAFRGQGEKSYVPVLIEIDGKSLAATEKSDVLRLEIFTYAFGTDGRVRDFLHHEMAFDLGQGRSALQASGLKFYGDLELIPGDYSLRTYVRNIASGVYSLRNIAVRVPEIQEDPFVLQPFFADPANKWLLAREKQDSSRQTEYPFHVKGESFVPAAVPVVKSGEPTSLKLVAYNFGDNPVSVAGRVLTPEGEELEAASIEGMERAADQSEVDRFNSTFKVDKLKPGEYRLEVTLTDQVTGEKASSWSRFDVAGP